MRYRTYADGSQAETCTSNPFGDGQACGPWIDFSNKHFTGKYHDDDTGLDYFGARYYASVQGRFLTPDWSATPEAVPYGHFETPQSLNLYAYVKNNPITDVDVDGHDDGHVAPDQSFDPRNGRGKGPGDDGYGPPRGCGDGVLGYCAGPSAQQQGGIGPISGYPETGANSWRAANDAVFTDAANYHNALNYLSPGDSRYVSPTQLKAQAMIESGGSPAAFKTDPLQVNVRGDFTVDKAQVTGLKLGQAMTPTSSAYAALQWLDHKSEIHNSSGAVTGYRSMHDSLRNYNGNTRVYPNQGGLQHRDWYANQILSLSQ